MVKLTEHSHDLFMVLAKDAGNWAGMPPTGGNIGMSAQERGNLTQLKRAGLIQTDSFDGETWVIFTDAGRAYAAEHGVQLQELRGGRHEPSTPRR